jgi:hypothetical protein
MLKQYIYETSHFVNVSWYFIFGVYILLRVWHQGEGFPSMQRYYSSFYYLFIHLPATCFGRMTIFRQKRDMSELLYWQRIRCFGVLINVMYGTIGGFSDVVAELR